MSKNTIYSMFRSLRLILRCLQRSNTRAYDLITVRLKNYFYVHNFYFIFIQFLDDTLYRFIFRHMLILIVTSICHLLANETETRGDTNSTRNIPTKDGALSWREHRIFFTDCWQERNLLHFTLLIETISLEFF